jgi:hypothetical protein
LPSSSLVKAICAPSGEKMGSFARPVLVSRLASPPYINIVIAVLLAGEGDLRSIGREDGVVRPAGTGEPFGVAALARDRPQVAAMDEDDMGAVEGWMAQNQGLLVACQRDGWQ